MISRTAVCSQLNTLDLQERQKAISRRELREPFVLNLPPFEIVVERPAWLGEVNLTKRVPNTARNAVFCPVLLSANGRVKPDAVLVNGKPESHTEGAYYIEWHDGGIQARAARIVRGLPPEPIRTPTIAAPAPPDQTLAVSTPSVVTDPSGESPVKKAVDALGQPSLSAPAVTTSAVMPQNSAATKWQSIEILFLSDHRIQIRVSGKSMESLNFAEFGFADGRTQNANKAWELLRVLAEEGGSYGTGTQLERTGQR
jgi:hypothetical protein